MCADKKRPSPPSDVDGVVTTPWAPAPIDAHPFHFTMSHNGMMCVDLRQVAYVQVSPFGSTREYKIEFHMKSDPKSGPFISYDNLGQATEVYNSLCMKMIWLSKQKDLFTQ